MVVTNTRLLKEEVRRISVHSWEPQETNATKGGNSYVTNIQGRRRKWILLQAVVRGKKNNGCNLPRETRCSENSAITAPSQPASPSPPYLISQKSLPVNITESVPMVSPTQRFAATISSSRPLSPVQRFTTSVPLSLPLPHYPFLNSPSSSSPPIQRFLLDDDSYLSSPTLGVTSSGRKRKRNSDIEEEIQNALETHKSLCGKRLRDQSHATFYAFGEMIANSLINLKSKRRQSEAIRRLTDVAMTIKIEDDEENSK